MFTKYFEESSLFLDTLHEDYYKFRSIIETDMGEKIISPFSEKIVQMGESLNALLLKNSFLHERIDFLKSALPVFLEKDIEIWNEAKDSQEGNFQGEGEQFVIQSWIGALTLVRTYVNNIEQSLSTLLSGGVFDDAQHAELLKNSAQIIAFESDDDKAKISLMKDVTTIQSLVEKSREVLAQIRVLRKVYIPKFIENLKKVPSKVPPSDLPKLKQEFKNNKTPLHLKLFAFFSILAGGGLLLNYFLPTLRLKMEGRSLPALMFQLISGRGRTRSLSRY